MSVVHKQVIFLAPAFPDHDVGRTARRGTVTPGPTPSPPTLLWSRSFYLCFLSPRFPPFFSSTPFPLLPPSLPPVSLFRFFWTGLGLDAPLLTARAVQVEMIAMWRARGAPLHAVELRSSEDGGANDVTLAIRLGSLPGGVGDGLGLAPLLALYS